MVAWRDERGVVVEARWVDLSVGKPHSGVGFTKPDGTFRTEDECKFAYRMPYRLAEIAQDPGIESGRNRVRRLPP